MQREAIFALPNAKLSFNISEVGATISEAAGIEALGGDIQRGVTGIEVASNAIGNVSETSQSISANDEIVRLVELLFGRGVLVAKEIAEFWNQRSKK